MSWLKRMAVGVFLLTFLFSPVLAQDVNWSGCRGVSEFYQTEFKGLEAAVVKDIFVSQSTDPNGRPIPLNIAYCGDNRQLGVFIPSSQEAAKEKSQILFGLNHCDGKAPSIVQISLKYAKSIGLIAYDDTGAVVDKLTHNSQPNQLIHLRLDSETGIRVIEVTGEQICLTSFCWQCQNQPPSQPDPREWISFNQDMKPGSPIHANILDMANDKTIVRYAIPGVWMTTVKYGDREFTQLQFPPVGPIAGAGFKQGDAWYEFPKGSNYPSQSGEKYRRPLAVQIPRPGIPPEARGLSKFPSTGKGLQEVGIDPAGARPMIPFLSGLFAANPQNAEEERQVNVEMGKEQQLSLPHPLVPAGYGGVDQEKEEELQGYDPPFLLDEEFYEGFKGEYRGNEKPYSKLEGNYLGLTDICEFKVPLLTVNDPQTIQIPTTIDVFIHHPKGVAQSKREKGEGRIGWDNWSHQPAIVNGPTYRAVLSELDISVLPIRLARYLILTPAEYEVDLGEFIDWKESKGLSVEVWTVGNSAGDDVAPDRDAIDAALEAYYNDLPLRKLYVLLVGDYDVIPSGRSDRVIAAPDGPNASSDHVYEVIGDARYVSMYVGRLSINNQDELNTQLQKILQYERGEEGGFWPGRVLLCANSQNENGCYGVCPSHPSKYAACVNEIANYGGYDVTPNFEVLHAGAADEETTRALNQDVIDAVNEGYGQLLYRGHGGEEAWLSGWDGSYWYGDQFDIYEELPLLANTIHPIVYSIACRNNRIKTDDCIGEEWMNREGAGAVAHYSASVNSYTLENHERAKGLFRAIYQNNILTLGPAIADAEQYSWLHRDTTAHWDNNTFCYLLLGDPEMTIRRENFDTGLFVNPGLFQVDRGTLISVIDEQKTPVPGVLVNAVMADGQSVNGFTNDEGELVLEGVKKDTISIVDLHSEHFPWQRVKPGQRPTPTPTPTGKIPVFTQCVEAGDFYREAQTMLKQVNLGSVVVKPAAFATGDPVPLMVADCSGDRKLDVVIPWSEDTAKPKAQFVFTDEICRGGLPGQVAVTLSHTNACKLVAYDESNTVVDTQTAFKQIVPQTLTLSSKTGIRRIETIGAEICIQRICWSCLELPVRPTPTPTMTPTLSPAPESGCVEAGDVYTSATPDLPTVNLGWFSIYQGYLSGGDPVPLDVVDCNNDGNLDITVPWSEETAYQKAMIEASSNLCGGNPPQQVDVILRHGNYCKLNAYDESNNLVDFAKADPHAMTQTLTLTALNGIRRIEIIGSEICIERICWACRAEVTDTFFNVVEVTCEAPMNQGGTLTFSLIPPVSDAQCANVQCEALAYAQTQISCEQCAAMSCEEGVACIVRQIVNGINNWGAGWSAQVIGPGLLRIEGPMPFDKCISSLETALPGGMGLPLAPHCPVTNLCNGVEGDERDPHRSGYAFRVVQETGMTALGDPIWVDDDNTTGLELGTPAYPFSTISAALAQAVTHTIRVMPGMYQEFVNMKDGVKLLGSGAETTLIDGMGNNNAVLCNQVGPTTVITGFTIQNAETGIDCSQGSPLIQENVIRNMNPASTNALGILLANASPTIQYNVIHNIGGMGIRSVGHSEPTIVNNTIYNYRYYAGIFFAQLPNDPPAPVSPIVKNNIVYRGNTASAGGILWDEPVTPQLAYNNVYDPADFTNTGGYYAYNDGAWHETGGGNGAISANPLFVDAEGGNFHLQEESPCIDAGDPAATYNDNDGSRNDIGAYGGHQSNPGSMFHQGSGFLFTSVGRIPVTEIVQAVTLANHGLANVSAQAAADYSIHEYKDAPFGGRLWIRGLFGVHDEVDYYKIVATSLDSGESFTLDDPLTKSHYTIALPTGTVHRTRVRLGPKPIGGVQNLYQLNKTGYWSQQDLRVIWNTTGLNGRYRLDYVGYREIAPDTVVPVTLASNERDHLVLWLDNRDVDVKIHNVLYADNQPIEECASIVFPHNGGSQLKFLVSANHPGGFLHSFTLDAYWGHHHFGGRFLREQYEGMHDTSPPLWHGLNDELLPPLSITDSQGNPMDWVDCSYRFRLHAKARTTDGYKYLKKDTYNVYHSVSTAGGSAKVAFTPADCGCDEWVDSTTDTPVLNPLQPLAPAQVSPLKPRVTGERPQRVFLPQADPIAAEDFSDTWINVENPNIPVISINKVGNTMQIHAYGLCVPTYCDWGEVAVPYTGNPFSAVYEFSFKTTTFTFELLDHNTLQVHSNHVFHDGSNRDYVYTHLYHRETIWVDDDNTSGVEDGTSAHPYNTIMEAVQSATREQVVRVLPGTYTESVEMKTGVDVMGSGHAETVIDAGMAPFGVKCSGTNTSLTPIDTILSGFTITNAETGVYCVNSNAQILENYITSILPGDTTGDGIRLDNSSPLIEHNVIYNVDGMGIRAQGESEPRIINNTIYDYRYYAGISFSALNIGAVSPIIKNNIIVRGNEEPVGGILWSAPASAQVAYNNVYGVDDATLPGEPANYAYHDGTAWSILAGGEGAISQDPLFIDPANGYFHLEPESPCIDAGDPAAQYNDNDGSRNDMGAFGGQRFELGAPAHGESGFIFTSIGKTPISAIVDDPSDPSHGLLRVAPAVADDLHIPAFKDAAFGGNLWIRGLFGEDDEVDYYQILVTEYGTSTTRALDDPLVKTHFIINPGGTVTKNRVVMGPITIDGIPNLYKLNREGRWSYTDLRYIWRTNGLNGKYDVAMQGYRETAANTLQPVVLPGNDLDHFTLRLNNRPVDVELNSIAYADNTSLVECENIILPHNGNNALLFNITAWHPDGFLRYFKIHCYWGNNRYGGRFDYQRYAGMHDSSPPTWQGMQNQDLPPLLPRDGDGEPMAWHTCPYHFRIVGAARITDGANYLKWDHDHIYQPVTDTNAVGVDSWALFEPVLLD